MVPNPYHARTAQKLEFAELYLKLRLACANNGDLAERAHEECFLYNLIGAKDSFLQEINHALRLGLPENRVNEKNLREALDNAGKECAALGRIEAVQAEKGGWLDLATWFRNQGTHRSHIRHGFFLDAGGSEDMPPVFLDPYTGEAMSQNIPQFLSDCFSQMVKLITDLRGALPE